MFEQNFQRVVQPTFTGAMPLGPVRNYLDQLLRQMDRMPGAMRQYVQDNRQRYERMPPFDMSRSEGLSVTRNTGTEATLKAGDQTYGFQKEGSRFSITDSNGKTTTIWGDPHYTSADGSSVDIHGDSVTRLDDGTKIFLKVSNVRGGREINGNEPTYAQSLAIVRPNGTTAFVEHITGDKPLEISTPAPGQAPLDFIREKMNGDFKPEAYLSINSQGQWTDMKGLPLTQQSANAMRDIARTQEPLASSLAAGCFAGGMFPRSLLNNPGFNPGVRNAAWYGGLAQTQNMFEQALRRNATSQIAMSTPSGRALMMQFMGSGMGAAGVGAGLGAGLGTAAWLGHDPYGEEEDYSELPMYDDDGILGCVFGGSEKPGRMHPGYSAAVLSDHLYKDNPAGKNIDLAGLRDLARTAEDPRLRGSAQFLVQDYDERGTQSFWSQIETSDVRNQYDNLSSAANFRRYAEASGYGGLHPLSTPYRPPMPDVMEQAFGPDYMRGGLGMPQPMHLMHRPWMGIAA